MLSVGEIAQPIGLTLLLALIVTMLLVLIATPIAWWLCRSPWRGKEAVAGVVALTVAPRPRVTTAVAAIRTAGFFMVPPEVCEC